MITKKGEEKMLYWNTEEYSFMLSVELEITEEEIVAIISSVVEKD